MKRCKVCGILKPLDEYYRSAGMKDGHRHDCKACNLAAKKARYDSASAVARVKQWRVDNPERSAAYQSEYRNRPERKRAMRDLYYRRTFGMTADDVDAMIEAQGGCCAICERQPERLGAWHVDHDHKTGRIRGVLCSRCNHAIGLLQEDRVLIERAAAYLRAG